MTHNTPYSPYKIVHHPDRLKDIKEGKLPVPLQVQIVISDTCNHNCNFCAYRLDGYTSNQLFKVTSDDGEVNNNPNRKIPLHKVKEILDDCKSLGVKAVQYTGGGEPTVHPNYTEILEYTAELGLEIALVTNGSRLSDGAVSSLVTSGKWVRVSVDAGTPETYSRVREVNLKAFDRTWSNIKRLADSRNSSLDSELIIGVGFVVTSDNWKEVGQAIGRAKEAGADNIRVSAMFSEEGEEAHVGYRGECSKLIQEAIASNPEIKVFDLFSERVEDLQQGAPEYDKCTYMKLNVYIGGDLHVYSCCNNAYNLSGKMGSLLRRSFRDFWEDPDTAKAYYEFNARKCARCMFNNKNRFANYLLEDNPKHVNFV